MEDRITIATPLKNGELEMYSSYICFGQGSQTPIYEAYPDRKLLPAKNAPEMHAPSILKSPDPRKLNSLSSHLTASLTKLEPGLFAFISSPVPDPLTFKTHNLNINPATITIILASYLN